MSSLTGTSSQKVLNLVIIQRLNAQNWLEHSHVKDLDIFSMLKKLFPKILLRFWAKYRSWNEFAEWFWKETFTISPLQRVLT